MMMNKNKGFKRSPKGSINDRAKEILKNIDDDNPVIKMFLDYKNELDDKHDRYEKIVKISRDITIESKRIIFLLHNLNTDIKEKQSQVFDEANTRLMNLIEKQFYQISDILNGFNSYQYHKAYTNGLQEFIEAFIFYQFLTENKVHSWKSINTHFSFNNKSSLLFPEIDYMLGVADFTGELMRKCINSLGVGNVDECFKICGVVKHIHTGFSGIYGPGNKELGRKLYVLKNSLIKMELVCYNIQIRGSEIPKYMLANVIDSDNMDDDTDNNTFF